MKKCIKCNEDRELSEYYTKKGMKDGHLNKCKDCCRLAASERHKELSKDQEWVESERARGREKYNRLKHNWKKPNPEKRKKAIMNYYDKYPEKKKAKNATSGMKAEPGNHLHHWSYNDEHLKDVIEVSISDHSLIHRFTTYDPERKMYRNEQGILLDTKKRAISYYENVIGVVLCRG